MSQDVSTNQRANESLAPSLPIQPWSAEAEADKLMDDLFFDLDRMLEGGSKLPTETVKPDYVSLESLAIPNMAPPPTVAPPEELGQDSKEEVTEVAPFPEGESEKAHLTQAHPERSGWSFEKLLLIAGLASLAITAILLLTRWDKLNWPGLGNPTTSPTAERGGFAADAEFISYMLRSLDAIERKAATDEPIASAEETSNALSLPSIPLPENPSAPNRAPTVLERVYIPVYPPQSPAAPTASAPAPTPASPVAPSPSRQATAPSPANTVPTLPATTPALPSQTPTATHTLVGLLELGDRSAALFKIDGSTQRIRVGEAIGNSGWTLVSVANQEAVIRRNGEVRSVYVGQKF